jgi:catechol 2,3-dioxygenase-like lactoylglutathione lyase family enzyme
MGARVLFTTMSTNGPLPRVRAPAGRELRAVDVVLREPLPTRATRRTVMNFVSTRIITADIKRLVSFYERITGTPLRVFTEDFAELNTPSATLALGSTRTLQLFGGDVARAADHHTAIIEFLVDDVDAEYRKLADVIKSSLVQEPTTMPWGNRSLLFRDPDGNLVNFFTPVTPESIKKFRAQG